MAAEDEPAVFESFEFDFNVVWETFSSSHSQAVNRFDRSFIDMMKCFLNVPSKGI